MTQRPFDFSRTGWRTLARVMLWCAIAIALTMAFLPDPPHTPLDQFGDKAEHMLAFGIFTVSAAIGYPHLSLTRVGERLSFLGAVVELVQSIPALHRDCDIMDWLADTTVIVAILLIIGVVRRNSRRA